MRSAEDSSELLVAHEVASSLRVKISTVYAAAASGRLPCVRLWKGRRKSLLRFRRSDIDELIRRGSPLSNVKLI